MEDNTLKEALTFVPTFNQEVILDSIDRVLNSKDTILMLGSPALDINHILNFRCLQFALPRACGKTELLYRLASLFPSENTIVIREQKSIKDGYIVANARTTLKKERRPESYIFVDECHNINLRDIVTTNTKLLVHLYTPK